MEQKVEQNAAAGVQEHVREMKSELVRIPKEIVEDEGNVLNRAIMGRERIQEQIVTEGFRDQEWALDEWIVARQILIVPNPRSLQGGQVHQNRNKPKDEAAKPVSVK